MFWLLKAKPNEIHFEKELVYKYRSKRQKDIHSVKEAWEFFEAYNGSFMKEE